MSSSLEEKIQSSLSNGGVLCQVAWDIAKTENVSRGALGEELNRLKIKVHDCQLGCFGSQKATHKELAGQQANPVVLEKIQASLVDGRLPCPMAFKIAETIQVTPREVGDTASLKDIRVSKCQLGCFP
jgi:hypothetical protein